MLRLVTITACVAAMGAKAALCPTGRIAPHVAVTNNVTTVCPNRSFPGNGTDSDKCFNAYEIQCLPDRMRFTIYDDYFAMRNLSHVDNVRFNNDSCTPQMIRGSDPVYQSSVYEFFLDGSCGTDSNATESKWTYSNALQLTGDGVDYIDQKPIGFQCEYPTEHQFTVSQGPFQLLVILDIEDSGLFELQLNAYTDASLQTAVDGPLDSEDYLHIHVATHTMDIGRTIYAEDCYISNYETAEANRSDYQVFNLLENGCVSNPHTVIETNNNGNELQFKSKIFQVAPNFEQAWITCGVRFCSPTSCAQYIDSCPSTSSRFGAWNNGQGLICPGESRKRRQTQSYTQSGSVDDKFKFNLGPYDQKKRSGSGAAGIKKAASTLAGGAMMAMMML